MTDARPRPARKYQIPAGRAGEIPRQALLDSVIGASEHSQRPRLIVVRGPAGYGKTTLLAQIGRGIAEQGVRVAWLTCDEDDGTVSHLMASISQAAIVAGMIPPDEGSSDAERIASLCNIRGDACLIFDDFEKAAAPETERFLERLFDRLGGDFDVLIGTRQPLRSWFLRREVGGEALSIGAGALRFTSSEIRHLLPVAGQQRLAEVEASTEGWPFAIQLIALRQTSDDADTDLFTTSGDSAGLFDYLSEQVMASLDVDQQHFLRGVSILRHVDARTADAVLGRHDSAMMIQSLRHLHPIMAAAGEEASLQIHPLFRHFLAERAAIDFALQQRALHERAALHFEAEHDLPLAIEHAVAAENPRLVLDIFRRSGNELAILDHGVSRVAALLSRIPPQLREASPELAMIDFVIASATGNSPSTLALADRLRRSPPSPARADWPRDQWTIYFETLLSLGTAFCIEVDVAAPLEQARKALLGAAPFLAFEPRAKAILLSFTALLALRQGSVETASSALAEYQTICESIGVAARQPSINPQRGLIAFAQGDLAAAQTYFERSSDLKLDEFGAPEPLLVQYCRIMLARVLYESARAAEAAALLENMRLDGETALPDMIIEYWHVRALAAARTTELGATTHAIDQEIRATGAGADARRPLLQAIRLQAFPDIASTLPGYVDGVLEELHSALARPDSSLLAIECLARAGIPWLIRARRGDEAHRLATATVEAAERSAQPLFRTCAHLLAAEAAASGMEPTTHLALALALTSAPQPFVDLIEQASPWILPALSRLGEPRSAALVRTILHHRPGLAPQIAGLTEREQDILVEAIVRNSTKDIARALSLSPETVKHHLRNIYGKLGVHGREEAVDAATAPPSLEPPPT